MKKKILAISLTVSLLAIAALGATLAYFTDTKAVTNTFTMGNVKIKLEEIVGKDAENKDIVKDVNHTYPTIAPGDVLTKAPYVTNTGANSAWVFMKLTLSDAAAFSALLPNAQDAVSAGVIDFNATNWTVLSNKVVGDDRVFWLAYNTELAPTKVTEKPFTKITVPTTWTNDDVAKFGENGFSLKVDAHAIQADNLNTLDDAYAQVNP